VEGSVPSDRKPPFLSAAGPYRTIGNGETVTKTITEPSGTVSRGARLARKRDPVIGPFNSKRSADSELTARIERWGRELDADYRYATRSVL
jgi:hypothetical protein